MAGKKETSQVSSYDVGNLDEVFDSVMEMYGINKEWITKRKNLVKGNDTIDFHYYVKIPKDIPTAMLQYDISRLINDSGIDVISEEKGINGDVSLKILRDKKLELFCKFEMFKELSREKIPVGFILYGAIDLSKDEMEFLYRSPHAFTIAVPASKEGKDFKDSVTVKGKKFALVIDDEIDTPYELKSIFSNSVLNAKVMSLIFDFGSADLTIVDRQSEFVKSPFFNMISSAMEKRGKQYFSLSRFINLREKESSDLISLFQFHINSGNHPAGAVFMINAQDFSTLGEKITGFRKKGHKIILPSEITKPKETATES